MKILTFINCGWKPHLANQKITYHRWIKNLNLSSLGTVTRRLKARFPQAELIFEKTWETLGPKRTRACVFDPGYVGVVWVRHRPDYVLALGFDLGQDLKGLITAPLIILPNPNQKYYKQEVYAAVENLLRTNFSGVARILQTKHFVEVVYDQNNCGRGPITPPSRQTSPLLLQKPY